MAGFSGVQCGSPALAGNLAYVSSYSGGLCAVDLQDGAIKWRLPIQGVGDISVANGRLFFVAPRQGLHSADLEGHVLWRQGLTEAGDLVLARDEGLIDEGHCGDRG